MSDDTPQNPAAGRTDEADGKETLPAIADVLDYLKDGGWKVTRTSLYRHAKGGKLLPDPDGSYSIRAVDKYARTFLKQKSTGKRVDEKTDELLRRKAELEVDTLEIQKKRSQLALDRDLNRFVRREEMEIELATWAGILDAGLTHWIKSHAAEWIRLVGGDMGKVGELISQMTREKDEHINGYTTAEFNVILEGEKGAEAPGDEEAEEEPC